MSEKPPIYVKYRLGKYRIFVTGSELLAKGPTGKLIDGGGFSSRVVANSAAAAFIASGHADHIVDTC